MTDGGQPMTDGGQPITTASPPTPERFEDRLLDAFLDRFEDIRELWGPWGHTACP